MEESTSYALHDDLGALVRDDTALDHLSEALLARRVPINFYSFRSHHGFSQIICPWRIQCILAFLAPWDRLFFRQEDLFVII